MKSLSNPLRASVEAEVRTLATCLLIKAGEETYGYTSHQEHLEIEGKIYTALPGFTCGTLKSNLLAGDVSQSVDLLATDDVKRLVNWLQDLPASPTVSLFYVDYQHLEKGKFLTRQGYLGTTSFSEGRISLEIRSLTDRLSTEIGELYSQNCRARLGDSRCKVNLTSLLKQAVVRQIDPLKIEIEGDLGSATYMSIHWKTGENQGTMGDIKNFDKSSGILTLFLPVFGRIAVGDKVELLPGCDKTLRCCHENYKNTLNFRGEPYIPEA